jgi:hypothetical protein
MKYLFGILMNDELGGILEETCLQLMKGIVSVHAGETEGR